MAQTQMRVFISVGVGCLLLIVFLFSAKVLGKTIVGFDRETARVRPWNPDLHAKWMEYVGRSLFLTVLFADLVLRVTLMVWREEKLFTGAGRDEFDGTMNNLSAHLG